MRQAKRAGDVVEPHLPILCDPPKRRRRLECDTATDPECWLGCRLPQRTTPRTRMLDSVPEVSNHTIVTCSFRLVDPPSSQAPRQTSPDLRGHRDLRHNKRVTTILRLWANYPMRIQNVFSVIAVEGQEGPSKGDTCVNSYRPAAAPLETFATSLSRRGHTDDQRVRKS